MFLAKPNLHPGILNLNPKMEREELIAAHTGISKVNVQYTKHRITQVPANLQRSAEPASLPDLGPAVARGHGLGDDATRVQRY